jgi:hypothetical protein
MTSNSPPRFTAAVNVYYVSEGGGYQCQVSESQFQENNHR